MARHPAADPKPVNGGRGAGKTFDSGGGRRGALQLKHQRQIAKKLDGLAEEPRPAGCKKLQGSEHLYRIGDYRIHQYDRIDRQAVWNTVTDDLPLLAAGVRKALDKQGG